MFESKKYIWTSLNRTYKYRIHACMLTIIIMFFWSMTIIPCSLLYDIYIYILDVFTMMCSVKAAIYFQSGIVWNCLNLLFPFFGYKLGQPVVQNVSLLTKLQQLLSNWYCQNFVSNCGIPMRKRPSGRRWPAHGCVMGQQVFQGIPLLMNIQSCSQLQ